MPLPKDIARLVLDPGFQPGVRDHVETERVAIKISRLPGITNEKTHMINPPQRKSIHSHAQTSGRSGLPSRTLVACPATPTRSVSEAASLTLRVGVLPTPAQPVSL